MEIAQIIHGEVRFLSDVERPQIMQSSLSYYPSDLLVVGWTAALVYDTAEGAAPHHSGPWVCKYATSRVSPL